MTVPVLNCFRFVTTGTRTSGIRMATFILAISLIRLASAQSIQPTILNLPSFPGGYSTAFGVNQSGQVVGCGSPVVPPHCFIWQNGSTTLLPDNLSPIAINNNGQLLGGEIGGLGPQSTWSNGVFTPLQAPHPSLKSLNFAGSCFNDNLEVGGFEEGPYIGAVGVVPLTHRPYIWSADGSPKPVSTFLFFASVTALNNNGQLLLEGAKSLRSTGLSSLLLQTGKLIPEDLGSLGEDWTDARALNDSGQVVGSSIPTGGTEGTRHPFLWQRGVMQDLGLPPGTMLGEGLSIDATGRVLVLAQDTSSVNFTLWVWKDGIYTQLSGYFGDANNFPTIAAVGDHAIVAGSCADTLSLYLAACIWNVP